jgi:thiol-disulfide isomerase/thioredoxin
MKLFRLLTGLFLASVASMALAGEIKVYSAQEFDKLAHDGQSVLVEVSAPWCPTCKAQKPIIDELSRQSAYKNVTILTVDFDSQKDLLKQFKVNLQSTLIAFKGGKETGRSVGDTTPSGIEGLFRKSLN